MRLSTFATALFAALASAAPAPATVDESILDLLHELPAGGPTLHKRYARSFLIDNGYIYANPTDPKLLAKVTTRCYSASKDLLVLYTDGTLCAGNLVPVAAWFLCMSVDGDLFFVQPLFLRNTIADDILFWCVDKNNWESPPGWQTHGWILGGNQSRFSRYCTLHSSWGFGHMSRPGHKFLRLHLYDVHIESCFLYHSLGTSLIFSQNKIQLFAYFWNSWPIPYYQH